MTKMKCTTLSCSLSGSSGSELDIAQVRRKFPIFANRPDYVFFDNAATTQKPNAVLRRIAQFYRRDCANAGRAAYRLSTQAASAIEKARKRVAAFVNANGADLAFTAGATESLNTVALAWGLANLRSGDEIMVCLEDHKSTVLPWLNVQKLLAGFNVDIKIVPIDVHLEGDYELKSIREGLSARTRLLAMTHVHHLYGLDMEVAQVREIVGSDVLISLDASQSVGHRRVDVQELGVDFLSFSGHKMFAATGVGVLWVAPRVQGKMVAIKAGGSSGQNASALFGKPFGDEASGNLAALLECGSLDIAAILSLEAAIDFIEGLGIERIEKRVSTLTHKLYDQLKNLPGLEFSPGFGRCGCPIGFGIIAFRLEEIATSDLAFVLDSENILVRTGDHCMSRAQKGDDYLRVSLHVYNTEAEIEQFIAVLKANLE